MRLRNLFGPVRPAPSRGTLERYRAFWTAHAEPLFGVFEHFSQDYLTAEQTTVDVFSASWYRRPSSPPEERKPWLYHTALEAINRRFPPGTEPEQPNIGEHPLHRDLWSELAPDDCHNAERVVLATQWLTPELDWPLIITLEKTVFETHDWGWVTGRSPGGAQTHVEHHRQQAVAALAAFMMDRWDSVRCPWRPTLQRGLLRPVAEHMTVCKLCLDRSRRYVSPTKLIATHAGTQLTATETQAMFNESVKNPEPLPS